ncbi:unnamed protein product, partial [Prorocentrum cordatum]
DLARADGATGERSTHTFLLYLSGPPPGEAGGGAGGRAGGCAGGQTVLLESLDADAPPLASVAPARGRLFLFPHDCPHKAEPVLRPPKLLLRGEMR